MPPSPIPAPLPPWAKFLLQVLPFIAATLQEALEFIGEMGDSTTGQASEWMHIQMIAAPAGSTQVSDRAVTTLDLVNVTNGAIDNSWTPTDFGATDTYVGAIMTGWAAHMMSTCHWVEARYYRRSFNPLSVAEPFTKSGPPAHIYTIGTAGTSSVPQIRQSSVTSTERTAYPKHWGRNYWPFPGGNQIGSDGYVPTTQVDTLASLVETNYALLAGNEFYPVVPTTQVDGVPTRGLLGVSSIQVDNNPDVQRRRRPKFSTYRKVLP